MTVSASLLVRLNPRTANPSRNEKGMENRAMSFHCCRTGFVFAFLLVSFSALAETPAGCARTITAHVSALDQPFLLNRLGAMMPEGMGFALDRDSVAANCPAVQACNPSKANPRLPHGTTPPPLAPPSHRSDCHPLPLPHHPRTP